MMSHFQESHMYNLRAFVDKPLRVDQEEQVPRVLSPAGSEVRPQSVAVSRHALEKQNYTLWYEAGERATQAAGEVRH